MPSWQTLASRWPVLSRLQNTLQLLMTDDPNLENWLLILEVSLNIYKVIFFVLF